MRLGFRLLPTARSNWMCISKCSPVVAANVQSYESRIGLDPLSVEVRSIICVVADG